MRQKTFLKTAGIIFLIVGLLHLTRAVLSLEMLIDNFPIPIWASYAAAILIGYMGFQGFKLAKAKK